MDKKFDAATEAAKAEVTLLEIECLTERIERKRLAWLQLFSAGISGNMKLHIDLRITQIEAANSADGALKEYCRRWEAEGDFEPPTECEGNGDGCGAVGYWGATGRCLVHAKPRLVED